MQCPGKLRLRPRSRLRPEGSALRGPCAAHHGPVRQLPPLRKQAHRVPLHRGHDRTRTDPDRTGFPRLRSDYSHARWLDYLLDVPMMFYRAGSAWRPAHGTSFRHYMTKGIDGHFPTWNDWDLHQTSVFPEVRIKRTIEVRGADCVSADLALAFCALFTGLLYCPSALEAGLALVDDIERHGTRDSRLDAACRDGLGGQVDGGAIGDWARELGAIADAGLARCMPDDRHLLTPLLARIESGRSPALDILDAWKRPVAQAVIRAYYPPSTGCLRPVSPRRDARGRRSPSGSGVDSICHSPKLLRAPPQTPAGAPCSPWEKVAMMRMMLAGMSESQARLLRSAAADLTADAGFLQDWTYLEQACQQARPDLVTIYLGGRPGQILALVKRVRAMYPATAFVAVAESAPPTLVEQLGEAGIVDLVLMPECPRDLRRAIQSLASCERSTSVEGTVIAVLGAKGGMGTTVSAVNIAAELAAR